MGWKQGNGLGKNQQGSSTNLRGIRREENLGIGAKTDTHGGEGYSVTSRNFHGILASLKEEHGDSKKEKKRRKKADKKKGGKTESGLTLSSKLVTAGHAKKMREAKDLTNKSKEDMAAIFGVRVEDYQNNSVWGRLSTLTSAGDDSAVEEEKKVEEVCEKAEKKERKKKDKKKRKKMDREAEESDDGKRRKKSKKEVA